MNINQIGLGPTTWSVIATATNATATATKAAVAHTNVTVPAQRHVITGFSFSASTGAYTGSPTLTVYNDTMPIYTFQLDSTSHAPLNVELPHPFVCNQGVACSISATALGAGLVATVCIRGMTISD